MKKAVNCASLLIVLVSLLTAACSLPKKSDHLALTRDQLPQVPNSGVNYLDLNNILADEPATDYSDLSPNQIADYRNIQYQGIGLDQCILLALENSEVARDLGVTVIRSPGGMVTQFDPALAYTNPRFGEEAALSEFDAQLATSLFFQKNDRPFNNRISGDTNGLFKQDLLNYNLDLSKRAATGTLFSLRNRIEYDANNQATNRFGSTWQSILEGEFRQPLLQGSGTYFNRIAGPSQQPGVYNGVLIARTNTEINTVRFEQSIYNLVSNIENAYWDLYFAYQELDAQIKARDEAYALWVKQQAKQGSTSSLQVVSAEEQYLRFENSIINSLEGRPVDGTRTDNGISGGTLRGNPGVRLAERRLRYLIGMAITDGTLLRPESDPERAKVAYEWTTCLDSALATRPELRQQRWVLAQKQLELTAARNFTMPRLDLVGAYRLRGLGKDLTGGSTTFQDDIASNANSQSAESSAFADLFGGDFQEWQLGAEMRTPVGFRRAHAAVRSAELALHRERALLQEQERMIRLGVSNAIAEVKRSEVAMGLAQRRYEMAVEYRRQADDAMQNNRAAFDVVLEAERRVLEARLQVIQAEIDHTLAIRNVHYEKGSLLEYRNVYLTESESSYQALKDYQRKGNYKRRPLNYVLRDPVLQTTPAQTPSGLAESQPNTPVFTLEDPQRYLLPPVIPPSPSAPKDSTAPSILPPPANQPDRGSQLQIKLFDDLGQGNAESRDLRTPPPAGAGNSTSLQFVDPRQLEVAPPSPTSGDARGSSRKFKLGDD